MLYNTFIKRWIALLSNVEKTFVKRLKTFLPNVGQYSCQTLDNTFAKGLVMSDHTCIGLKCNIRQILAVVEVWSI